MTEPRPPSPNEPDSANGVLATHGPHAAAERYDLSTEIVFVDRPSTGGNRDQYLASSPPIYQTATFKQVTVSDPGEYEYTRSSNPTRSALERHLAKIMGAQRALVVSSGMAALDVITRLLKSGDEVIAGDDLYGGTNRLLKYLNTNHGIGVHHIDTTDVQVVKSYLKKKTAMVLLETPTNPLIKIVDLPAIAELSHEISPKCLVVVDNTMMSPYLMNPLSLGADIVYESGTKYLNGHHDLMSGVIAVKDPDLGNKLHFAVKGYSGSGLAPFDCWLLLRGIKTLAIRIEKQQSNAIEIAYFLQSLGFTVRYPGLPTHPGYELHKSMTRGPGAVLSFETEDTEMSEKIVNSTRLWGISMSFGCVNSIIRYSFSDGDGDCSMPCKMSHASIDAETRKSRNMPEDLIRLCVGIENVIDLIRDLQKAMLAVGAIGGDPLRREIP